MSATDKPDTQIWRGLDARLGKLTLDMKLREIRMIYQPPPAPLTRRWRVIGLLQYDDISAKCVADGLGVAFDAFDLVDDKPAAEGAGPTIDAALNTFAAMKWEKI